MSRRPAATGPDAGSVLLLSIGLCAIGLLLIWTVIDASIVFLARRDLAAAVDGAALDAAQQVDTTALYGRGIVPGAALSLDPVAVATEVASYVRRDYPPSDYPDWSIVGTTSPDGSAVSVSGRRTIRLPVIGTITVVAEATARSQTR